MQRYRENKNNQTSPAFKLNYSEIENHQSWVIWNDNTQQSIVMTSEIRSNETYCNFIQGTTPLVYERWWSVEGEGESNSFKQAIIMLQGAEDRVKANRMTLETKHEGSRVMSDGALLKVMQITQDGVTSWVIAKLDKGSFLLGGYMDNYLFVGSKEEGLMYLKYKTHTLKTHFEN